MKFRRILFWSHLVTAVATGLVILLLAATGLLLTYERQMLAWAEDRAVPEAAGRAPLGPGALVQAAMAGGARPGATIAFPADPAGAVRVGTGRREGFLLDPFTGAVLPGAGEGMRGVFATITALHRWLALPGEGRATGAAITGAANLAFLFLLASGLVLWWPRLWRWGMIRPRLVPRLGLPNAKARDWNWHHAFGAWALLPLLAIIGSGVVISYPWASALVYRAYGEAPPAGRGPPASARAPAGALPSNVPPPGAPPTSAPPAGAPLPAEALPVAAILQAARAAVPGARVLTLTLPAPQAGAVQVVADAGNGAQPALRTVLTLARADGAVLARRGGAEASPATRARGFLRFLHTGEVFGLPGQTVAGLACLATLVLGWTGLALAWRRLVSPLLARRRLARMPRPVQGPPKAA